MIIMDITPTNLLHIMAVSIGIQFSDLLDFIRNTNCLTDRFASLRMSFLLISCVVEIFRVIGRQLIQLGPW